MIFRLYQYIYLSVTILVVSIFLLHFDFVVLPLACFLLGILLRAILKKSYLLVFSFLIPILPAFAGFEASGFPNNYFILPILVLTGMVIADSIINKEFLASGKETIPRQYIYYLLILSISFIFVILRWSNLTLSPLAFFKDTPIAPTGQRISFGIIFPVLELALFSLSPLYFLLLRRQSDPRRISIAFLSGQSLSIIYSLFQHPQVRVTSDTTVLRGLASDASAFGFLSALAILLSWYLYSRYNCKKSGLLFVLISLLGILNSTTRIGLLAVILVFFLFVFSAKKKVLSFILIGALLMISLLLYIHFSKELGSNFLIRLESNCRVFGESLKLGKIVPGLARYLTSGRSILLYYSWECLRNFPLTGVGAGNFVFWVMRTHSGDFLHHLPANQYFFITSSVGLPGLFLFLIFCFGLFSGKKWPEKMLLGMFLFLLIFNDYLWFSEIFLAFWLFCSLGNEKKEKPLTFNKNATIYFSFTILFFILFNLLNFSKLHPKNWARAASTAYEYGFSYPEKENGRGFRWTGAEAGFYVYLNKSSPRVLYKLICSAPLPSLNGQQQAVDVYWRGRFYQRVIFHENGEYSLWVEDAQHREGFLEFRVHPAFNLKKLGLGPESRELGVQVSGPGI